MKLDVTQLLGRGDHAAFPWAIFPVWLSQCLGPRPAGNQHKVNVETYVLKRQPGDEHLKGEAASVKRANKSMRTHTRVQRTKKTNTRKAEIA